MSFLLEKLIMQDNGCPLGRNELRNYEWIWLGHIKDERFLIARKEGEEDGGR